MDKELLNGSGIKGQTAYDAIRLVNDLTGCVIYNGRYYYLIVNESQNGIFIPILKLRETEPTDSDHPRWMHIETGTKEFWTDVSMCEYGYLKGFEGKRNLGCISDDAMNELKEKMADALGIRVQVVQQKVVEKTDDGIYKKLYEDLLDKLIKARSV